MKKLASFLVLMGGLIFVLFYINSCTEERKTYSNVFFSHAPSAEILIDTEA